MQQLDLFGTLIGPNTAEKKKAEETVVPLVKNIDADETEVFVPILEDFVTVDSAVVDENKPPEDIHTDEQNDGDNAKAFSSKEEEEEEEEIEENSTEEVSEPQYEETIENVDNSIAEQVSEPTVYKKQKKTFVVPSNTVIEKVAKQKKEKVIKLPQKRGRKSIKEIEAEVDLIEVPEDDILFQKQYYAISEVAEWFRVNTSLLRFWENEFDVLKPRKNRKGDRLFRPEDVKNLQLIYHLLREKKYTVEGAKDYIKSHKKKADTQLQLTQSLQKIKAFLLDLKANLQS